MILAIEYKLSYTGDQINEKLNKIDTLPIICDAEGRMILLNDHASNNHLNGLRLFGKTTQDGVPSVDNPISLVNVGDSGSVGTCICNKNLCGSDTATFTRRKIIKLTTPLPAGTYTVSATVASSATTGVVCNFRNDSDGINVNVALKNNKYSSNTVTTHQETQSIWLLASNSYDNSAGHTATWTNLQIEPGETATEYEPRSAKTLTVQTPNGLAGIPVDFGGNYTDEFGQNWICDEVDYGQGKRIQRIGRIDSYAGEEITGCFMSSTGELSTGATVYYVLDTSVEEFISSEEMEQYSKFYSNKCPVVIYNGSSTYMNLQYVADTKKFIENETSTKFLDTMVNPVTSVWEQRMLERIDQMMVPTVALRKIPKTSGYSRAGTIMTGVSYSSLGAVRQGERLVGMQIPLSTYYSALENPASKMYTEDRYQDDGAQSTYYGANCSSFVSYVCGFDRYYETGDMGLGYHLNNKGEVSYEFPRTVLEINNENDLFQIRRGDILANTIGGKKGSEHVRLVRDLVYDRKTGKLIGFNIAESWKPYCMVTFYDFEKFLNQLSETPPYGVLRRDDSYYGTDVTPIKYSKSVYPDKGDGGKYNLGKSVWLYIPDPDVTKVYYAIEGLSSELELAETNCAAVNGVKVYEFVPNKLGTYTIHTDLAPYDPCTVVVVSADTIVDEESDSYGQ